MSSICTCTYTTRERSDFCCLVNKYPNIELKELMRNIYIDFQHGYFSSKLRTVQKYAAFKSNIGVLSHFQLTQEQY